MATDTTPDDYFLVNDSLLWLTPLVLKTTQLLGNMESQCSWFAGKDCHYKNLIFSPASLVMVANYLGKALPYRILPTNDILSNLETMVWLAKPTQRGYNANTKTTFSEVAIGPNINQELNSFLQTRDFDITKLQPRPKTIIAQKFNFFLSWQDFFIQGNDRSLDDGSRIVPAGQISLTGSGYWEVASNSFAEGVRVPLEGGYVAEFYLLKDNKSYSPNIPFDKLPETWSRQSASITIPAGVETSYAFSINNAGALLGVNESVALAQFVSFDLIKSGVEVRAASLTQAKIGLKTTVKTFTLEKSFYLVIWKPAGVSKEPVVVASIIKQPLVNQRL